MVRKDFVSDRCKNHPRMDGQSFRQFGPTELLSAKRTRFLFHDDTTASGGETMLAREYMAMGVIADDEVGNPSNIASAVFHA